MGLPEGLILLRLRLENQQGSSQRSFGVGCIDGFTVKLSKQQQWQQPQHLRFFVIFVILLFYSFGEVIYFIWLYGIFLSYRRFPGLASLAMKMRVSVIA
jgi:hypothetical protein